MCVYEVLAGTVCEYPGKCTHTQTHMPKMKVVQKIGHMFGTNSHLSYMTGPAMRAKITPSYIFANIFHKLQL